MKKLLLFVLFCTLCLLGMTNVSAQVPDGLLPVLEAYSRSDWAQVSALCKKGMADRTISEADGLYWLVLSEMSAGNYAAALNSSTEYLTSFSNGRDRAEIMYQRGRALYELNYKEDSIKQLYDFVKAYPNNDKVSFGLFWIAESLFDFKNYERASLFYRMVIDDYPASPKREAAAYRLEIIEQRKREEELLQLLKVTHEESLKAAEDYEKKVQRYEQAILAYQKRIMELEAQLKGR